MTRASAAAAADDGKREQILRVALETFSQKGFDAASTREIAAQAGVNHGLIRYYFGPKLKLWQAAVDLAFAELQTGIQGLAGDTSVLDLRERTARLIRDYVHFVARNPEFVRLMHEEGKRRGPRMRWLVDRHIEPLYRAIETLFERGQISGALTLDVGPVHFFYILAGSVGLIFHQSEECKRVAGVDPFAPEIVEAHARAVEILFLGPRPSEEADR